jgi:hypothetical protein
MKKKLHDIGVKNYWLLDGLAAVLSIAPPDKRSSNRESASDIADNISKNNVHLTELGQKNVATVVCWTLISLRDGKIGKDCSADNLSGAESCIKKPQHFWRGFVSPVGSAPAPELKKKSNYRHHPYSAAAHRKKN